MAEGPPDGNKSKKPSEAKRKNANALIASKLRGYYDSIVDEGTPSQFLDLLEKLHDAEAKAKSRKP